MLRLGVIIVAIFACFFIAVNLAWFDMAPQLDWWSIVAEGAIFITLMVTLFSLGKLRANQEIYGYLTLGFCLILIAMLTEFLDEIFHHPTLLTAVFEDIFQVSGFILVAVGLKKWVHYNVKVNENLLQLAREDGLTGLFVRRFFLEQAQKQTALWQRNHQVFSILMLDIDRFKAVNDNFGHDGGDQVLVALAELLKETLRSTDLVSRWGGEEFIVLLPDTERTQAIDIAEKIRDKVANLSVSHHRHTIEITISIGITQIEQDDLDIHEVINRADLLLYQAKENGRNRCESALSQGK
ncbi:GGDEF domain-containing protein [Pseudoalteromonas ulvae]|uniref:diguanylate cyclase n=1 Tax=Pseudoalteromonas ulvae TaxID=107327 RepID=A0A244CLQ5_PSEDV|nr:GGDEF domain-containing protein [Pseudoalteromonas ulvae]OUL56540.1 hypothetical protein B1199_17935 [Pseudoalteromonas ulvae]